MIRRFFSETSVPPAYRSNFNHFYWDIGWFGVLSGSAANFLGVYAARLGASSFQMGLLGSMGAVISLLIALPTARWLERRRVDRVVFWTSIAYRLFYLLWIPLPWLFDAQGQIWALIVIALLMGIPGVPLGVGFNALFAGAVPEEWRAHVAGIRNVVFSVVFMASSLGSGYILDHVPFPGGYQIVFAIGAFGALMSSLHLHFIRPIPPAAPLADRQPGPAVRPVQRRGWRAAIRADVWKTPFGAILLVMLFFTLAQNLPLPLFPIYFVRHLALTDSQIGVGTAIFYLTHFLGSTQLARITRKLGHHKVTAYGSMAMCIYPLILGLSAVPGVYFVLQAIGGVVFSMVGGAQANYLLENIPADDRPAYLAWYTVAANASILAGSLAGPALAGLLDIRPALILFALLRLAAGLAILRWGKR